MNLLPYAYALLVFGVITFLFFVLGRMFLNVETIYDYDFETIQKDANGNYGVDLQQIITQRGKAGWKFERCETVNIYGASSSLILVIFLRTRNKMRLFG